MAIEISNASGGGQNAHPQVKGKTPGAGRPSRSFLETFQRLPQSRFRELPSGLKVAVIKEGAGSVATNGKRIKVHYSGWLENGERFDSSSERGQPFEFTLGAGRVIKGWEEGLKGIKPGERRQLIVPAELGYGKRQVGTIPPGSVLIFNVEAVTVGEPAANPKGTRTVIA